MLVLYPVTSGCTVSGRHFFSIGFVRIGSNGHARDNASTNPADASAKPQALEWADVVQGNPGLRRTRAVLGINDARLTLQTPAEKSARHNQRWK